MIASHRALIERKNRLIAELRAAHEPCTTAAQRERIAADILARLQTEDAQFISAYPRPWGPPRDWQPGSFDMAQIDLLRGR